MRSMGIFFCDQAEGQSETEDSTNLDTNATTMENALAVPVTAEEKVIVEKLGKMGADDWVL